MRLRCWLLRHGPALLVLAMVGLFAAEAAARVGGGQGYSGGGRSSSSGGGFSGGGGGSDGDLIFLLIWLCLEHPIIGIPLTICVAFVAYRHHKKGGRGLGSRYSSHHDNHQASSSPRWSPGLRAGIAARRSAVAQLRAVDPDFSEVLFIDHAQLVYARVHQLRGELDHPTLHELLGPAARKRLNAESVEEIIFGATRVAGAEIPRGGGGQVRVKVAFETNYAVVSSDGGKRQHYLVRETWSFARAQGVRSPGPDRMRALGCGSCGSTLEVKLDGTCPNCEMPRGGGTHQWHVASIDKAERTALAPPRAQLGGGGVEAGTRLPSVVDPDLAVQQRKLFARHPEMTAASVQARTAAVFHKLQEAWSNQSWELARPYETDALFAVHRFWMDRYRDAGLVNKLDQVEVFRQELVKVDLDPYLESITVRVYARMLDWMERLDEDGRPTGELVGGSKTELRTFSEYWTFVRTIGGKQPASSDPHACPSCGAPLDDVNMAGVCGYCESKITTGDFDWVLSRIEQDDAYVG